MTGLAARDLQHALEVTALLAAIDCWADFQAVGMAELARLLEADGIIYHELDLAGPRQLDLAWPYEALTQQNMAGYADVMPEHPFVVHLDVLQREPALRLTDLRSPPQWRESRVYRESLRGVGIDDQMASVLGRNGSVRRAVTCFRRGRCFEARHRELLACVRHHTAATVHRLHRSGGSYVALQTVPELAYVVVHGGSRNAAAAKLTPREGQVMTLLSLGRSSAQVAQLLGCSPRTVDKHVEHICPKLGVASRAEAVSRWNAGVGSGDSARLDRPGPRPDGRDGAPAGLV